MVKVLFHRLCALLYFYVFDFGFDLTAAFVLYLVRFKGKQYKDISSNTTRNLCHLNQKCMFWSNTDDHSFIN
jgi:hypothetical protein